MIPPVLGTDGPLARLRGRERGRVSSRRSWDVAALDGTLDDTTNGQEGNSVTARSEEKTRQSVPAGAVFHRCALQVNPLVYAKKFRGKKAGDDGRAHAEAIVSKAAELGVSVLAITNHNEVGGVSGFRAAVAGRGITVFPGFELTSLEGIHILCIYPPGTEEGRLQRFLGEFGIRETRSSSAPADKSFSDILAAVSHQGGVAIAAHVTTDNGLFKVLQGQAKIKAWRSPDLLAIQIPGTVDQLHPAPRSIVRNEDPIDDPTLWVSASP